MLPVKVKFGKEKPSRAIRDFENLIKSVKPGADVMSLKNILLSILKDLKTERGDIK